MFPVQTHFLCDDGVRQHWARSWFLLLSLSFLINKVPNPVRPRLSQNIMTTNRLTECRTEVVLMFWLMAVNHESLCSCCKKSFKSSKVGLKSNNFFVCMNLILVFRDESQKLELSCASWMRIYYGRRWWMDEWRPVELWHKPLTSQGGTRCLYIRWRRLYSMHSPSINSCRTAIWSYTSASMKRLGVQVPQGLIETELRWNVDEKLLFKNEESVTQWRHCSAAYTDI